MVFRRSDRERELVQEEDANGLNIVSGDDDDEEPDEDEEEDEAADLFEEGQQCDVCAAEEGRVGLDPTCRGAYDGDPQARFPRGRYGAGTRSGTGSSSLGTSSSRFRADRTT